MVHYFKDYIFNINDFSMEEIGNIKKLVNLFNYIDIVEYDDSHIMLGIKAYPAGAFESVEEFIIHRTFDTIGEQYPRVKWYLQTEFIYPETVEQFPEYVKFILSSIGDVGDYNNLLDDLYDNYVSIETAVMNEFNMITGHQ